ncbi:hypothetical protein C8J57DRAFT_1249179 [Mycena rebaudengoi]|nr:hypothetical protein C8J57DRAFT_1249179 [Mycena rebaudengoi]
MQEIKNWTHSDGVRASWISLGKSCGGPLFEAWRDAERTAGKRYQGDTRWIHGTKCRSSGTSGKASLKQDWPEYHGHGAVDFISKGLGGIGLNWVGDVRNASSRGTLMGCGSCYRKHVTGGRQPISLLVGIGADPGQSGTATFLGGFLPPSPVTLYLCEHLAVKLAFLDVEKTRRGRNNKSGPRTFSSPAPSVDILEDALGSKCPQRFPVIFWTIPRLVIDCVIATDEDNKQWQSFDKKQDKLCDEQRRADNVAESN